MGKYTLYVRDFDDEQSTMGVRTPDLTAANITAVYAALATADAAFLAVLLGQEQRYIVQAKRSPQGLGASTNPLAQRESKALVRYHETTTLVELTMELPCPDLSKQNTENPGYFYIHGDANNHADWNTLVGLLEGHVEGPSQWPITVDEIVHIGANL